MTVAYRDRVTNAPVSISLRERLLDAARDVTETSGWAAVSMSGIAAAVGVSRQTVHNEFGTRHQVAEALALRELTRFLDAIRQNMAAADDLIQAIRDTCLATLRLGQESVLVRTIVGSVTSERDVDFLMILTTESGEIVDAAGMVVKQAVELNFPDTPFTDAELDIAVEAIVRIVLSHITRPSKPPEQAAEEIAWIIGLALAGRAD